MIDYMRQFYQKVGAMQQLAFFVEAYEKNFENIPFFYKNVLISTPLQKMNNSTNFIKNVAERMGYDIDFSEFGIISYPTYIVKIRNKISKKSNNQTDSSCEELSPTDRKSVENIVKVTQIKDPKYLRRTNMILKIAPNFSEPMDIGEEEANKRGTLPSIPPNYLSQNSLPFIKKENVNDGDENEESESDDDKKNKVEK